MACKTDGEGRPVFLEPGVHEIYTARNESFDPAHCIKSKQNDFNDFNDFGAIKVVRIREGFKGVKTDREGNYVELPTGTHLIDTTLGETFNPETGIQAINSDDYTLGSTRYVTIREGELGESYRDGQFVLLEPGFHALPTNHRFVKRVGINQDIVDLGALIIVTVKEGQVAVINTETGVEVLAKGKHEIRQSQGNAFNSIITTAQQGIDLPPLKVMCSDRVEMCAQALLVYSVEDPLKTVGQGITDIISFMQRFADATLRNILRRFNSSDIAPSLHVDEQHDSSIRSEKLEQLHDECVAKLKTQAREWGIHVVDLQIIDIHPADDQFIATMREIGARQSIAESNLRQAEIDAQTARTQAKAQESKIIVAKIEQEESQVRAQTIAATMQIESEAEASSMVTKAQAEAKATEMRAQAESKRIATLCEAAKDAPPVIDAIMTLEAKAKILEKIENPVFVQPGLGDTTTVHRKGNNLRFFTTSEGMSSPVVDALTLHQLSRSMPVAAAQS